MQSKCNKYNRQQSEHVKNSRSLDLIFALRPQKSAIKKNSRSLSSSLDLICALRPQKSAIEKWQTNQWLSLIYPLYSVYSIFTPTWISVLSILLHCSFSSLWLRLCSREIVCTCRTFRTFVRIAVYLNFHFKTNMTQLRQLMTNMEKIISLRSLTAAALQLLEKETAEERL